jgi:ABC-type multidrug transport system ATPase subunit
MSNHLASTLSFRNITYKLDSRKRVQISTAAEESTSANDPRRLIGKFPKRVFLDGIQGMVKPGEVMSIMGGSGAGYKMM